MENTTTRRPDGLDRAFHWLRGLGIQRDGGDRWIGGVASGLAHRLGVDPVIVRVVFVVLGIFGGVGLTAYLVCLVLLPDRNGAILAERAVRGGEAGAVVLTVIAALSLGSVLVVDRNGWSLGWVVPVGLLAWWLVANRARNRGVAGAPPATGEVVPPPPPGRATTTDPADPATAAAPAPESHWSYVGEGHVGQDPAATTPAPYAPARPHRRGRPGLGLPGTLVVLGLASAAYGLGFVLDGPLGFPGSPSLLGRILALATLGVAIVVAALRGRTPGLAGVAGVVLALSTTVQVGTAGFMAGGGTGGGMGDRFEVPSATTGDVTYGTGMGDLTVDLRNLSTTPTTVPTIDARAGMGNITIKVPEGLTVQVLSDTGLGEIRLDGRTAGRDVTVGTGTPDAVVHAQNGVGNILIEETK